MERACVRYCITATFLLNFSRKRQTIFSTKDSTCPKLSASPLYYTVLPPVQRAYASVPCLPPVYPVQYGSLFFTFMLWHLITSLLIQITFVLLTIFSPSGSCASGIRTASPATPGYWFEKAISPDSICCQTRRGLLSPPLAVESNAQSAE